jgi:hypothetical protein
VIALPKRLVDCYCHTSSLVLSGIQQLSSDNVENFLPEFGFVECEGMSASILQKRLWVNGAMLTLTDRQEGHGPLDNTRTICYPFGDLHSISSPRTISMRDRQCSAITSTDLVSSLEVLVSNASPM